MKRTVRHSAIAPLPTRAGTAPAPAANDHRTRATPTRDAPRYVLACRAFKGTDACGDVMHCRDNLRARLNGRIDGAPDAGRPGKCAVEHRAASAPLPGLRRAPARVDTGLYAEAEGSSQYDEDIVYDVACDMHEEATGKLVSTSGYGYPRCGAKSARVSGLPSMQRL